LELFVSSNRLRLITCRAFAWAGEVGMGITKSISPKTTSKTTSQEVDGVLSGVAWGAWTSD
jgi:hypothetical protein